MRNRRDSVFLEYNGERLTIADWGERLGILPNTIVMRLRRGYPVKDILQPDRRNTKLLTYNGKTQTITAWAKELGVPYHRLWERIYYHQWSVEDALNRR